MDDGSKVSPISSMNIYDPDRKIKIFIVKYDYGFNSHGCRNLIAHKAAHDWIVFLDCDRIIIDPEFTFNIIRSKKLDAATRYKFICHVGRIGLNVHSSINDFLIHRDHFLSVGGYDEELIGFRDGDRSFFKQLLSVGGKERVLQADILLTRPPSVLASINEARSPNDRKTISFDILNLLEYREKIPDPKKPTITFEWEELC